MFLCLNFFHLKATIDNHLYKLIDNQANILLIIDKKFKRNNFLDKSIILFTKQEKLFKINKIFY